MEGTIGSYLLDLSSPTSLAGTAEVLLPFHGGVTALWRFQGIVIGEADWIFDNWTTYDRRSLAHMITTVFCQVG